MAEQGKRKADDVENDATRHDTLKPQIITKRFRSSPPSMTISGLPPPSVESIEILVSKMETTGSSSQSKAPPSLEDLDIDKVAHKKWSNAAKLQAVFVAVHRDPQWRNVLNPAFQTIDHCSIAIKNNANLARMVDECIKTEIENWQPLFDDPVLLRRPAVGTDESMGDKLQYFKTAFETEYNAKHPENLLIAMDMYYPRRQTDTYYNRSFSVVQSSGMGKSRLMDYTATLRFTLPFNLHEGMPGDLKTYPPSDDGVYKFLKNSYSDEFEALKPPFAFLEALFTLTVDELANYSEFNSPKELAQKWYAWMNQGSRLGTVGAKRSHFYSRVVDKAEKLQVTPSSFSDTNHDAISSRTTALKKAAKSLTERIRHLCGTKEKKDSFDAIVYFDEAHTLFSRSNGNNLYGRSPYFSLMYVLSLIKDASIFFVFLSTNSSLQTFAPSKDLYPSIRVQESHKLIPPFFELPFDVFAKGFTTNALAEKRLTLLGVCELGQMVKFGRPMWYSHYQTLPLEEKGETIRLALLKFHGGNFNVTAGFVAKLAMLDSRVLIEFDPVRSSSRKMEAELVKSYMRCVYNIPESREHVATGYPSEPILSEAAARLLSPEGVPKIDETAPDILEQALNTGLLAKGERGELVARTLLIVAHDMAVLSMNEERLFDKPFFHRPINVMIFLKHLLSPKVWDVVKSAKPFHYYEEDKDLGTAFADMYINFTHFVRLGNFASFRMKCATELLKRGAAIQTFHNHRNQDLAIPMHKGEDTEISEHRTSIIQFQVQNVVQPKDEIGGPTLIEESSSDLPILSIVMQLGASKPDRLRAPAVVNTTTLHERTHSSKEGSSASTIHRRHYSIVLYGCKSDTYSCVRKNEYETILQSMPTLFDDYVRKDQDTLLDSIYSFHPMWNLEDSRTTGWTE